MPLLLGVAVAALLAGPVPAPETARLDYFVGKWQSSATIHPGLWGPGGELRGEDTCEKMPGGFFVICRSDGAGPAGEIHGLGVLGYDPARKVYTWNGFTSLGENAVTTGSVKGKVWTYTGERAVGGRTLQTRFTLTEGPAGYVFKAESSADGRTWSAVMDGQVTKK